MRRRLDACTCGASGCFGDVTGDGCFDINDVGWMVSYQTQGEATRTSMLAALSEWGRQQANCDHDAGEEGDAAVNAFDLQYLRRAKVSKIYFLSYDVAPSPTVGTNDYWGVTAVLYDARQQRVGGSAVRVRAQAKLIYALGDVAYTGAYEYEAGGGSADAAEPTSAVAATTIVPAS